MPPKDPVPPPNPVKSKFLTLLETLIDIASLPAMKLNENEFASVPLVVPLITVLVPVAPLYVNNIV